MPSGEAFRVLDARIKLFVSLPFDKLDRLSIKREVDAIAKTRGDIA